LPPMPSDVTADRSPVLRPAPPLAHGSALILLALLGMVMLWGAPFVQDDMGIIYFNDTVHRWDGVWRSFTLPYWPPANSGELYRPLTIAWFTLQWMVGDGAVWVFRGVSLALYIASTLVTWRLLRLLLPPTAAWFGAALFAVHPVHVEAVALAVNQAEILVGLLLTLAVHLRIREGRGEIAHRAAAGAIWALFLVGVFIKEQMLVLPGLLLAADLFVDRDREGWRARLGRWGWHYGTLMVTAAAYWTLRTQVLGDGTGARTAEALDGLSMAGRAYTMLGVPAEWLRLLLWPADLQGDWNLLEWVPTAGWSLRETAGSIALASVGIALVLAWRRRPLVAFGIAWIAVTLAPVANILIPTGIILAERTLFSPTIGLAIILADLVAPLEPRWPMLDRWKRIGLAAVGGALLFAGAVRSAVRHTAWQSRPMFLATQVLDAPTSWRARLAYSTLLADLGDTVAARHQIRTAVALRADRPIVVRWLADAMRSREGKCIAPIITYEEILERLPGRNEVRASLVACQLDLGRYADARARAAAGVATGGDTTFFRSVMRIADSAAAAGAPPATVRLTEFRGFTLIGTAP
jgi:hypothetical protein